MCGVTTCCQEIVDYGISLARNCKADLYFIHIIHNPSVWRGEPADDVSGR